MGNEGTQEVEVTVEGVITRLMPCAVHAEFAPGAMVLDDGDTLAIGEPLPEGARVIQNPNGYVHDCPDCAQTPTTQEELERTVTRHVL